MGKKCKLSELCDVRDGTHDSPEYVQEGYPLVTSKNIVDGRLDLTVVNYISEKDYNHINERSKVDLGDIIMPMIGTIGNPHLIEAIPEFAIKNVALIKFPKSDVSNKFIYYFLQSDAFKTYVAENNRGGTQKFLSLKDIRNMDIPALPYEKQLEICVVLDKVSELITLQREQLAKLDQLVKSRFIELFDACNCRISTFGKEFSFISRGKSPSYVELSDLAVINQACIYWNGLNFDKVKYNDVSYSGDRILQFGDVLVNSTGTGTLGRANIFMRRSADKRYMADSHVTIIRGSVSCHPVYIKCYLEQAKIQDAIYRNCVSGSTNQIELSKEKFKELELPVPPMTLQQQFAAFVEQTDKSKLAIQQSLQKLETLKKSLMQKYFG